MKGKGSTSLPESSGRKLHPADWVLRADAMTDVLREMDTLLGQQKRRRRRAAILSSAAAAVMAIALWWVPYARDTASVNTATATRETLALTDGSQADLNARTSLRTDFRYGRRIVRLERGEAFFSVTKDVEHPFLVETPSGTVRVTGTRFNVRLADGDHAEVTLLEGSVRVERPDAGPLNLVPGQSLTLDLGRPELRTLTAAQLENRVAWRDGRAVFDGDSLADATARFAAFHGVTIAVAPDIAQLHLGGSYPLADLKEFLDALETTLPVRVLRGENSVRILAR